MTTATERPVPPVTTATEAQADLGTHLAHLRRRLERVLDDLGLYDLVGSDWCSSGPGDLRFEDPTGRRAERLVWRLEELAGRHDSPAPYAHPTSNVSFSEQLSLFSPASPEVVG